MQHLLNLAWAAGFVDGEGYMGVVANRMHNRPHACYRLNLSVTQNELCVLQSLQATLNAGGKIYPVKRLLGHNRQIYTLVYDGKHALAAIAAVLPYLHRKQHLAQMCMKAWVDGKLNKHSGPKGWPTSLWKTRERLYRKIRRMQ